jgi:putative intracellular protease/amidase
MRKLAAFLTAIPLMASLAGITAPYAKAGVREIGNARQIEGGKGRVIIFVTSDSKMGKNGKGTGCWLSEVTHPYYALVSRGLTVDIASPLGGDAPIDPRSMDMNDPENKKFLETPETAALLKQTLPAKEIALKAGDFDAILFAGGHGAMWDFPTAPYLQSIARTIYDNNGIVAAVCHGPAALVNLKLANGHYLVAGKRVAAFTNDEEQAVHSKGDVPFLLQTTLQKRGAHFEKGASFKSKVVVDGRLITGQNPASAKDLGVQLAKRVLEHNVTH